MNHKERKQVNIDLRKVELKLERLFKTYREDPATILQRIADERRVRDNCRLLLELN